MISSYLAITSQLIMTCFAMVCIATNSDAQDSYDFVEAGTSDILATMELSVLPANSSDVVAFALTSEGEEVFPPLTGALQPDSFFGGGSIAEFGSLGLHGATGQASWAQDVHEVSGPGEFFTYHFSMNFFPFNPPFFTSSLVLSGDWTASAHGLWLLTPDTSTSGDFDGDGDVDGADFLTWQVGFPTAPHDAAGYALWESNYGTGSGPGNGSLSGSAVPEPSTLVLFGLVSLIGLVATKRRR